VNVGLYRVFQKSRYKLPICMDKGKINRFSGIKKFQNDLVNEILGI